MAQITKSGRFICVKVNNAEETAIINKIGGGVWSKKWDCWTFHNSPRTAYFVIKELKPYIKGCDRELIEDATRYYKAAQTKKDNKDHIPNLLVDSWDHQSQCYAFASILPGAELTMEMGCGKTCVGIGLVENNEHQTILTVSPKKVMQVWPPAVAQFSPTNYMMCVPHGKSVAQRTEFVQRQKKKAEILGVPFWLLLNYEALWRDPMGPFILSQFWDIIIYDEIHKIKAANGVASKFCAKLVKVSAKRYGLTGTPLPHGPEDIFAQYRALDPSVYGTSYTAFKSKYMEFGGFSGKEIQGYKNMEDYHERLESISFRVTADILGLPPVVDVDVPCKLEDKTMEIYAKFAKELYIEIEQGEVTAANALVKLLKLQQLTCGFMKLDDGSIVKIDTSKMDVLKEMVEDLPEKEPLVVFCRFTPEMEGIHETLRSLGRKTSEVSGRKDELKHWQAGHTDDLIVNIKAGEAGLDFTRSAHVFYTSKGFDMGAYDQSRKRVDRPGQTRSVRYYHLNAPNTVDLYVERALKERRSIVEFVISEIKNNKWGHKKCMPGDGTYMSKEAALELLATM